ncbi:MAG: hypothetical protein HOD92_01810, partial [Deltaproteobacteria bacterium]|nr:hypothetical protein [Deltaproteobacteria bacterium]
MIPDKYRVLSPKDVEQVHEATLKVLAEQGIRISDPEALKILTDNGAVPGDDGFIKFNENLVKKALHSVPDKVVLYDRNGKIAAETNGPKPYFSTGLFCRDILDHDTHQIRPFTFFDIQTLTKVCDHLPNIHLVGSLGFPTDLPIEQAALAAIKEVLVWTKKPVFFYGNDEKQARDIWDAIAEAS